jgi:hypothetical protein
VPTAIDWLAAAIAKLHADRVYRRFLNALEHPAEAQLRVLQQVVELVGASDFGRRYRLERVKTVQDLRRAVPIHDYEDLRPWIERVFAGELSALFSPGQRVLMFATTSGTTARPKFIPVTPQFVRDYRRGWNTFGIKLLRDHPEAILRAIIQCSGRHDAGFSPAGVPYGAITGLLAQTQKRVVRRFYVGPPQVACLPDPRARYYVLMRLGIVRDVGFAVTANPATLIQLARTADQESETLIRDVHNGTLSRQFVPDPALHKVLSAGLRPARDRAAELERLRASCGSLRPRDYWNLAFLACWTGGSMGHYLPSLRQWYGELAVRDIGLLASEGRVTIPLEDNSPAGVLDVQSALFEFIPAEQAGSGDPQVLLWDELECGRDYVVVLTNSAGLVRYRLGDVVRVRGRVGSVPVLEFLYRWGRVASVAGEKLTENQVVEAVCRVCNRLGMRPFDFVMAPVWDDPPYYRLTCEFQPQAQLLCELDRELAQVNEEYGSRRKSLRLGGLRARVVTEGTIVAMDRRLAQQRGSTAEQYKRPCLFTDPGSDDAVLFA